MPWPRRIRPFTRLRESESRMRSRHSRACMKDTVRTSAIELVQNEDHARLGCRSARLASKLRGSLTRLESPAYAQCLAGRRGVHRNARGRACSPNAVGPLANFLPLAALLVFQITL